MSTKKKKRKLPKRRMPPAPPRFEVGDRVRVKYGIADPDFADIPLGGWAGTVAVVDPGRRSHAYQVQWNRYTLDHMHPIFRARCERDGLQVESCCLSEEVLEPDDGACVPLQQPTRIVTRPLRTTDPDDRIRAIFGLTSDDPLPEPNGRNLEHYRAYLAANMSFPFKAGFERETGLFTRQTGNVSVLGLADRDYYCPEEVGLMFEVRHDGEQRTTVMQGLVLKRDGVFHLLSDLLDFPQQQPAYTGRFLPLRDLVLSNRDANRQLLKDFDRWVWGRG